MSPSFVCLPIEPKYKKDNGLWVLDIDGLANSLPTTFAIAERSLVYLPPGQIGGNHLHPRQEAFIGIGESLKFYYQDEHGQLRNVLMMPNDQLQLIIVSPNVPHAIKNEGTTGFGLLLEFANQPQQNVTRTEII